MHRSGTSALTGVMGLAGAGLPAHLMPATSANPRGYFESRVLYELHEELLAELGTSWSDVTAPARDWLRSASAARWIERLAKAVDEEFGDQPLTVIKDPRACRLVPLWARVFEALGMAPGYVLMIRHPLEVAASLRREHQLDERRSVLLWLDHLVRAERDTRGAPRSIVSYEDLLDDWRVVVRRISRELDLPFPRLSRRVEAEVDEFLSEGLRHQRSEPEQLGLREDVVQWVRDAYGWALRAGRGEPAETDGLDRIAAGLEAAELAFGPLLASAERSRSHEAEQAAELRGQIEEWRHEVARHHEGITAFRKVLGERDAEIARMREERGEQQQAQMRLVEWVKALLQWAARASTRGTAPAESLDVVFEALDAAEPTELPALAAASLKLTTELASVHEIAEGRAREVSRLDREAARLRAQLAIAAERAEQREQESARLAAELASARAELSAIAADTSARGAELERLQEEARSARGQLDALREAAQAQLDALRREAAEQLEATRLDAESRLAAVAREAEEQLQLARGETAALRERLERTCADLERAQADIADRSFYIDRLKTRLAAIEGSLSWRALRPARAIARGTGAVFRK